MSSMWAGPSDEEYKVRLVDNGSDPFGAGSSLSASRTLIKRFAFISKYEYNGIVSAWFNSELFAENGFCRKELNQHAYCLLLEGKRVRQSVSWSLDPLEG